MSLTFIKKKVCLHNVTRYYILNTYGQKTKKIYFSWKIKKKISVNSLDYIIMFFENKLTWIILEKYLCIKCKFDINGESFIITSTVPLSTLWKVF